MRSQAVRLSTLVGEVTGIETLHWETELQVMGYAMPLISRLWTCTGAVPESVTRLLVVTMKFAPFTENAEFPPAPAISASTLAVRCGIQVSKSE